MNDCLFSTADNLSFNSVSLFFNSSIALFIFFSNLFCLYEKNAVVNLGANVPNNDLPVNSPIIETAPSVPTSKTSSIFFFNLHLNFDSLIFPPLNFVILPNNIRGGTKKQPNKNGLTP